MPTLLVAHLQNRSSQHSSQVLQKSHQANAQQKPIRNDNKTDDRKRRAKA